MSVLISWNIVTKLMNCFPNSVVNHNAEFECAYNNDTFSINEIVDKTFATFYPTVLIGLENQNLKGN